MATVATRAERKPCLWK